MTLKISRKALDDLRSIRAYTEKNWGRDQWLRYYQTLAKGFETIEAFPQKGRDRSLFAPHMRSILVGQHIVFYLQKQPKSPVIILRIIHQKQYLPALSYYEDIEDS